jgi:hypothetical protein
MFELFLVNLETAVELSDSAVQNYRPSAWVFLHDHKVVGRGEFLNVRDIARIGSEIVAQNPPASDVIGDRLCDGVDLSAPAMCQEREVAAAR